MIEKIVERLYYYFAMLQVIILILSGRMKIYR